MNLLLFSGCSRRRSLRRHRKLWRSIWRKVTSGRSWMLMSFQWRSPGGCGNLIGLMQPRFPWSRQLLAQSWPPGGSCPSGDLQRPVRREYGIPIRHRYWVKIRTIAPFPVLCSISAMVVEHSETTSRNSQERSCKFMCKQKYDECFCTFKWINAAYLKVLPVLNP